MNRSKRLIVTAFVLLLGFAAGFVPVAARPLVTCGPNLIDVINVSYHADVHEFSGFATIDCPLPGSGCCFAYQLLILKWNPLLQSWVQAQNLTNEGSFLFCDRSSGQNFTKYSLPVGSGLFRVIFTIWDCNNGPELGSDSADFTIN